MKKPTIFMVSAEPSGDLLGARLINRLITLRKDVRIIGVGGESMKAAGMPSLFDVKDLAIMGFFEVFSKAFSALKKIHRTVDEIARTKPDVVVTIDSVSFNFRIAKLLKKKGINIPVVHYVAPQVWAWKKGRAKTVHKFLTEILALLPFEPKIFEKYGMKTTFVGHSVIEAEAKLDEVAKIKKLAGKKEIVLLLPGSRSNEVSRLLPEFIHAARLLQAKKTNLCFIIPTVETVKNTVEKILAQENFSAHIVFGLDARYAAMAAAKKAIAASGTVSLELAKFGVPHVVAYKFAPLTYALAKLIIRKQPFMNLINMLMGKRIIPELLQSDANAKNIVAKLAKINLAVFKKHCQDGLAKLQSGNQPPSINAAKRILSYIKK